MDNNEQHRSGHAVIGEAARAVEVVVALLLADPVDGRDEVLVGDGRRRLFQLPQAAGEPA